MGDFASSDRRQSDLDEADAIQAHVVPVENFVVIECVIAEPHARSGVIDDGAKPTVIAVWLKNIELELDQLRVPLPGDMAERTLQGLDSDG